MPLKNVLTEKVALRGRDRGRELLRGARRRARGMINVRGQQLDGERGRPQGRRMSVGGTRVISRNRDGIPTPARGVRTRGGARAAQNVADVNEVAPYYFCIYCQEKYTDPPREDWLQCQSCAEWYHEACDSSFSVCDICDS